VSCQVTPKSGGCYFLLAKAQDTQARDVYASLSVYVTGPEYDDLNQEDDDRIELILDMQAYEVGDVAKMLIKNPYADVKALITYERFGILKQVRKSLKQGTHIVDIPIDRKDYAPGFYVSVHLIQGRKPGKMKQGVDEGKPSFKMGVAKVDVVDPSTKLSFDIKTEKQEYKPKSLVKAQIKVANTHKKVELMVAVVDDKILSLVGDYEKKYDVHDRFYTLPSLNVQTSQSLTALLNQEYFSEIKGERLKGLLKPFGARKSKMVGWRNANVQSEPKADDALYEEETDSKTNGSQIPRTQFLPAVYWNPSLITDPNGHAAFEFEVPDNLTTWRILVVGADQEHRFGFDSQTFATTKKVMIEPALPNFVREGDMFEARFTLYNRTGRNKKMKAKDMFEKSQAQKNESWLMQKISDQGKGLFAWPVKVPFEELFFPIDIQAQAGKYNDYLKLTLPIKYASGFDVVAQHGSTLEGSAEVPLKLPEGIFLDRGGLEVEVSPSMIGQMNDSISYMMDYPYLCWEQRLSRLMVLVTAMELKDYIDLDQIKSMPSDPNAVIEDILSSISQFQASNGGMGYWKKDIRSVSPYLSIYTGLILQWLSKKGVEVPKKNLNALQKYISRLANGLIFFPKYVDEAFKTRMRAFAAYEMSLRGKSNVSKIKKIFAKRNDLDLMGLSFLLSSSIKVGAPSELIKRVEDMIVTKANVTSGKIQFEDVSNAYMPRFLGSAMRTNCRLLTTLLETGKATDLIQPLARHILNGRDQNRWNNTQENMYCFKAMVDYAGRFETTKPDYQTKVSVGSATTGQARFKGFKQKAQTLKLPMAKLRAPKIKIQKEGQGRLYYTTRLKYALKNPPKKGKDKGFQVQRFYEVKQEGRWVPAKDTIRIKRGDLVRVTLKVKTPATRYQVALIDQLPAGLEPLNAALATTSKKALEGLNEASSIFTAKAGPDAWWEYYWGGGFYHQEMRLAGPQYFADYLNSGEQVQIFMTQAIATGTFTAPPARAEEMYDPEVYGTSTPATFVISE